MCREHNSKTEVDPNCQQCEQHKTEENPGGCPGRFEFRPEDCPQSPEYVGRGRWE